MSEQKVIVLLSGGVDSTTALYHAHRTHAIVEALSFSYGAKHNDRELPCAQWHAKHLGVPHMTVSLDFIGDYFSSNLLKTGEAIPTGDYDEKTMRKTVVPFRNGIMLSIAAGFAESCGANALVIAAHAGDHAIYPDCRPEFMGAMENAIQLGTYARVHVQRPFITMTKAEIIQRGVELRVNFSRTWSCYVGGEMHCGICGTCLERREAFIQAGVFDSTKYRD